MLTVPDCLPANTCVVLFSQLKHASMYHLSPFLPLSLPPSLPPPLSPSGEQNQRNRSRAHRCRNKKPSSYRYAVCTLRHNFTRELELIFFCLKATYPNSLYKYISTHAKFCVGTVEITGREEGCLEGLGGGEGGRVWLNVSREAMNEGVLSYVV